VEMPARIARHWSAPKIKSAIPRASVLSDTNGRKFPYMILPQIGFLKMERFVVTLVSG